VQFFSFLFFTGGGDDVPSPCLRLVDERHRVFTGISGTDNNYYSSFLISHLLTLKERRNDGGQQ
jgi:hypothetical protein